MLRSVPLPGPRCRPGAPELKHLEGPVSSENSPWIVLQCTVLCTIYYILCTMHHVLCTMYYVLCTVYNVLCTVILVYYTMLYCTIPYNTRQYDSLLCYTTLHSTLCCARPYPTLQYYTRFCFVSTTDIYDATISIRAWETKLYVARSLLRLLHDRNRVQARVFVLKHFRVALQRDPLRKHFQIQIQMP